MVLGGEVVIVGFVGRGRVLSGEEEEGFADVVFGGGGDVVFAGEG